MTESHRPEDVNVYNERSLQRLAWAIEASVGQFKLIFAHCNYASVRSQLVERLQHICSVDIHILTLKESDRTLYATIQAALGERQPAAVMVLGLESVRHLDQMLTAADQVREEFRKQFHFPLVLWVNDTVGQKLMELAPNFESWGTRREFAIALEDLANWLRQAAKQCFVTQFNAVQNECLQATELEAARQDLLKAEPALDPELEANLESLLGFAQESDHQLDAALEHYQRAVLLWQQLNQVERQVYTLVRIAFCYHLKALQHQETDNPDAQSTREYLQQCQQIFQRTKRPNLIANSIATLGTILRDLQNWELLQRLAQIALQVHETESKPLELAQDYGCLAEVALAQEHWGDAKQLAQKALEVLSAVPRESRQIEQLSLHRLVLAMSEYHLGQIKEAIRNLKIAIDSGNPQKDLKLYLDSLNHLQRLYFEHRYYLDAYGIKQKQRSVEQQFGLQAFIGAGRLESQHQENLAQTQAVAQGTIAPEILASGRQRDVEQLVERIAKNETKLIVIHGQSGVGKSSLVNAGLIPALQGKQIGIQTVVAVPIRFYTNWIEELGRLLIEKREENEIDDRSTASPTNPNSTAAILEQLHQNDQLNRRTVLIFDQFEEFFFACHLDERRKLFKFLAKCLQILSVKVVLSLREDYLHYLLECDRLLSRGITSHGILSQDVLYPLNNFSRDEARLLIEQLTERANFHLEPGLIDELVDDLASEMGCVRPIELQVVGAQLQAEQITTLARYQAYGSKEELVQRYLAEVVADCGEENQQVANLVLYLLTDEKETRPLKTRVDLERELETLAADTSHLDLVLAILVKSGLVFELLEFPADRYQLVHDYLAGFIRRQQEPKLNRLKAELEQERQQREQAEALSRLSQEELAQAKRKARQQVLVGTAVLVVTLIASAGVLAFSGMRISHANNREMAAQKRVANADKWVKDANQRVADADVRELSADKRVKDADKREQESRQRVTEANKQVEQAKTREANANKQAQKAQQAERQAKKNLATVTAQRDRVEREAKQRTEAAQQKVNEANQQVAAAQIRQQEAQAKEREAQQQLNRAKAKVAEAERQYAQAEAELAQAEAERQTAQQATKLEQDAANIWRKAEAVFSPRDFSTGRVGQIDVLLDAMQVGQRLKKLIRDDTTLSEYPSFTPVFVLQQILYQISEKNQWQHDDDKRVMSVIFSPDGNKILTASGGKAWLRNHDGTLAAPPLEHGGAEVWSVVFSRDGHQILTAANKVGLSEGVAVLWDVSGRLVRKFPYKGIVKSVSFSPDNRQFITCSSDNRVVLWNLDGTQDKVLRRQERNGKDVPVYSATFSPNGDYILVGYSDGAVLWTRDGNQERFFLPKDANRTLSATSVSFSPNGDLILIGYSNGSVVLQSLRDKRISETFSNEHQKQVTSARFSSDGRKFLTSSFDGTVVVRDVNTPNDSNKIRRFENTKNKDISNELAYIYDAAFNPINANEIVIGLQDGRAILWDLSNLNSKPSQHLIYQGEEPISSVKFSTDGRWLIAGASDGKARLWNRKGTLGEKTLEHRSPVNSVDFSLDGRQILTGSQDGRAILWDLNGNQIRVFQRTDEDSKEPVKSVNFSEDTPEIVSGYRDGIVILWTYDGQVEKIFPKPTNNRVAINNISIGKNGKEILVAYENDVARLWNRDGTVKNDFKHKLPGREVSITSASFSPDGEAILTSSEDGTAVLWDRKGNRQVTFPHDGTVTSASFSQDGKMIVTGSIDGQVTLWSHDGYKVQQFQQDSPILSISFSPDSREIITGAADGTVHSWQIQRIDDLLKLGCTWLREYSISHQERRQELGICNPDLR